MAQFDPIVPKSGILTVLGTDTLRADRVGAAFTTTGLAAGDACQVSGTLTLSKAVNTSTSPIVGIYDGETGAVVRKGIVVATFESGVTLANGDAVYLSSTAGALTNVKPTMDVLHEVGAVVDAVNKKILLQQKPVIVLPATPDKAIWILQYGPNQVTKWSTTGTLLATLPTSSTSYRMIYDGAGNIWIGSWADGVKKINEAAGTLTKTYSGFGTGPRYLCSDGVYLWILTYYGERRMVIADETVTGADDYQHGDGGICYDFAANVWGTSHYYPGGGPDIIKYAKDWSIVAHPSSIGATGREFAGNPQPPYIYAADGSDGSLRKVAVADGTSVRWDLLGMYGCNYSYKKHPFTFDGAYVWGLCTTHSKLHKIDVTTGTYIVSYNSLSGLGDGLCFDGTHLWHHGHNGSVYVLRKTLPADGSTVAEYPTGLTAEYTYQIIVNRAGPSFKYLL